jgi:spore coat protein U-like protein
MLRILLAAILLVLSVSLAQAALCTVHVGDLAFGAVDTIGNAAATATADIDISCDAITPGTTTITMCGNIGEGSGGVVSGVRQSIGGQGTLGFALYSTSGTTAPVGSASSPGLGAPYQIDVPVSGADATLTTQIYGIVPASQSTTPVGDYHADFTGSDAVFTYAEGALDCSAPVGGTDAGASFAVTASIAANCDLETADLNFGTAGIIGENIDADTDLSITCTPGTSYGIAIDGGGSHDPDNRVLRSGGDTVSYGLYSDVGRGDPWGTASGTMVSGSGDGTEQRYGVYGRIPPQPAAPGAYADTVVVTITY